MTSFDPGNPFLYAYENLLNTILSWLKRGREQLRQQLIGGFDND